MSREAPPGDPQDLLDELVVVVASNPRGFGEARIHRGIGDDAGQWVELDDIGHAEAIHPNVDAAPVAAPEGAIRIERDALRLPAERFGDAGRRALEDRERMLGRVPDPFGFVAVHRGAPCGSVAKSNPTIGKQRTSPSLPRIATVNSGPGR